VRCNIWTRRAVWTETGVKVTRRNFMRVGTTCMAKYVNVIAKYIETGKYGYK